MFIRVTKGYQKGSETHLYYTSFEHEKDDGANGEGEEQKICGF